MKNILLYSLAAIGTFSVLMVCYNFYKHEHDSSVYQKNCLNVKIGMTLQEAKKIMGDYHYSNVQNRSEIWTNPYGSGNNQEYYLSYPTGFPAPTGTYIFFDPTTQIVTKIICGE